MSRLIANGWWGRLTSPGFLPHRQYGCCFGLRRVFLLYLRATANVRPKTAGRRFRAGLWRDPYGHTGYDFVFASVFVLHTEASVLLHFRHRRPDTTVRVGRDWHGESAEPSDR